MQPTSRCSRMKPPPTGPRATGPRSGALSRSSTWLSRPRDELDVAQSRRGATLQPAMPATTDHDLERSILAIASRHKTLEEVVRYALSATPPQLIHSVVVQDEYTHD